MKKALAILMCLSVTFSVFAGGQNEASSEEIQNHVVIYNNSGGVGAIGETGSNPEKLQEVKDWLFNNTGVTVDVIVPVVGEEETKLNLLLASGEQVDSFWGRWDMYKASGALQPITDQINESGSNIVNAFDGIGGLDSTTDGDGNIWGIPRSTPLMPNPLWTRTDWLKKVDLPMPTTVDELELVLKAFKEEQPGGVQTIPMIAEVEGKHGSTGIYGALLGAFTPYGNTNWIDKKGSLKHPITQEGFIDFLKTMNKWYEAGYIYPEFAALNRTKIRELISAGRVGVSATWCSNVGLRMYQAQQVEPEAFYDYPGSENFTTPLTGKFGLAETQRAGGTEAMLVSSNANPELIVNVMDFLYSDPKNSVIASWGPEGKDWDTVKQDNKGIEYKLNVEKREGYNREYFFSIGLSSEARMFVDDPQINFWTNYLTNGLIDLDRGKPVQDVGVVYDLAILENEIPTLGDMERMIQEEIIKFIMGGTPVTEENFNSFLERLDDTGMKQWEEVHTRMYKEQTGN